MRFHKSIEGPEPLLAVAIHSGHDVRDEVARMMALDESDRLREEDPYTDALTTVAANRLVVYRSRFEVDLNRPRRRAVYRTAKDAWGLEVWKQRPARGLIARSLEQYDAFYSHVHQVCSRLKQAFGRFVVLDLHSYNHRREGIDAPAADPAGNPEVNIGTDTVNRRRWSRLVDRFMDDLRAFDYLGRTLDVRENVKFRGGQLVRYIHETFGESGCALAIEFKKFFMDEWTGAVDARQLAALREMLRSTRAGLLEELGGCGSDV